MTGEKKRPLEILNEYSESLNKKHTEFSGIVVQVLNFNNTQVKCKYNNNAQLLKYFLHFSAYIIARLWELKVRSPPRQCRR